MADTAPFFIIGAGRSGTTLLRLIMTGHSRLHIPPETWFLRPLVQEFPLTGALTQEQRERAIEMMVRHERWPDMEISADELHLRAGLLRHPTLADLINIVYRRCLSVAGKPRLGDKTPHYFAIVPQLVTLYPTAKFIHLLRDGHDVAMSWIDAGWERYYEPGFEWPAAVAQVVCYRTAYPDRIFEVRYEALMREPEAVVRGICAFLDEPFEPAMLEWQQRADLVAPRDRHLHTRLPQPLSEGAVAMWQHRLSAAECFAIEACLYRELLQSGYDLRFGACGWHPLFRLTGTMLRGLAPLLRRGIPYLQRRGMLRRTVYF